MKNSFADEIFESSYYYSKLQKDFLFKVTANDAHGNPTPLKINSVEYTTYGHLRKLKPHLLTEFEAQTFKNDKTFIFRRRQGFGGNATIYFNENIAGNKKNYTCNFTYSFLPNSNLQMGSICWDNPQFKVVTMVQSNPRVSGVEYIKLSLRYTDELKNQDTKFINSSSYAKSQKFNSELEKIVANPTKQWVESITSFDIKVSAKKSGNFILQNAKYRLYSKSGMESNMETICTDPTDNNITCIVGEYDDALGAEVELHFKNLDKDQVCKFYYYKNGEYSIGSLCHGLQDYGVYIGKNNTLYLGYSLRGLMGREGHHSELPDISQSSNKNRKGHNVKFNDANNDNPQYSSSSSSSDSSQKIITNERVKSIYKAHLLNESFYSDSPVESFFVNANKDYTNSKLSIISIMFTPYFVDGQKGKDKECIFDYNLKYYTCSENHMIGALVKIKFTDHANGLSAGEPHECKFFYSSFQYMPIGSICEDHNYRVHGEVINIANESSSSYVAGLGLWHTSKKKNKIKTKNEDHARTSYRNFISPSKLVEKYPTAPILLDPTIAYKSKFSHLNVYVRESSFKLEKAKSVIYTNSEQIVEQDSRHDDLYENYRMLNLVILENAVVTKISLWFKDRGASKECTFYNFNATYDGIKYAIGSICEDNPKYAVYPGYNENLYLGYTNRYSK